MRHIQDMRTRGPGLFM